MDTELLYAIAQVAVAFAGFSGIAVAPADGAGRALAPCAKDALVSRHRLPGHGVPRFPAGGAAAVRQRADALVGGLERVLGLTHLVLLSPAVLWFALRQVRAEWQPAISPIQSSLIGWSGVIGMLQVLAALGVGLQASPGLFTIGLLAFLLFAAVDFVFLVAGEGHP